MTEYLTISKTKPEFPDYLDFGKLRDVGIGHLQALSGEIWTDYNLHDPGITILEVLCYAITDLGYRSNFEIKDLLALKPDDTDENNFFTPDQILTCNPVTELDWRKRLIDIDGVRNAWLEKLHNYVPPISIDWDNSRLRYTSPDEAEKPDEVQTSADELQPTSSGKSFNPRGLYRVHLDLDPAYRKDACGHFYQEKARVLKAVNQVLLSYRNLCEDFHEVLVLEDEEIALCSDIELNADADPEDVLVNIYLRIQEFLLPRIQFYTLQELLAKGRTPAEIFAGRPSALSQHDPHFELPGDPAPVLYSNGFIDVEDLAALTPPKEIHTSDLYREILQAPGVAAVRKLSIANVINGLLQSQGKAWSLPLTPDHRPLLTIDHSRVTLYKGDLPLPVDRAEVKRRYFEQQVAAIKTRRDAYDLDLRAPQGQYFDNLADHYSIQHDFPLTYGISEDGLPDTMPALRKAQAKQLKGYLVFFDQLLANYLAQLAHVRDLFSWKSDPKDKNHEGSSQDQKRTYFTQALDFPAWSDILVNDTTDESYLKAIEEDNVSYQARRNRFLNHLLARFAESFTDYALLNYQVHRSALSKSDVDKELIADKTRFLKDYPRLSRDRNRAFNYSDPVVWDTPNISGFKHRVSRLLGINDIDDVDHDVKRRSLSPAPLQSEPEDLIWSLSWVETNDNNRILTLKSQQTYSEKTEAQRAFEQCQQLAQNSQHYQRLTYYGAQYGITYGYAIVDAEGRPLAVSSIRYDTQTDCTAAIAGLQTLLQASVEPKLTRRAAGYRGEFKDKNGNVWLQSNQRQATEQQAWQHINDLLKLADNPQNLLRVDSDDNLYGWELIDDTGNLVFSSPFYSSPEDRNNAIAELQEKSLEMEGFHILEHILLRPRRAPAPNRCDFALIDLPTEDLLTTNTSVPLAADLVLQDNEDGPYSFTVEDGKCQVLFTSKEYSTPEERRTALKIMLDIAEPFKSQDEAGFYFSFLDENDAPLGRSRYFNSEDDCDVGIAWLRHHLSRLVAKVGILPEADLVLQDNEDGPYSFIIKDGEDRVLFTSTDFSTPEDRQTALEIMLDIAELLKSQDEAGFYFSFLDENDVPLGRSRYFDTAASRDAGIAWLRHPLSQLAITNVIKYALSLSSISGCPGFEFLEHKNNHIFHVNDSLGQTLFYSQRYDTPQDRNVALESVIRSAVHSTRYTLRKVLGPDWTVYYFILCGPDGIELGRSRYFDTVWKLEICLEWFQQQAYQAADELGVTDLELPSDFVVAAPIRDRFLPISVSPTDAETRIGDPPHLIWQDPYSFWVSIILPYWPQRFQNMNFRRFVERTLRLEAPAHVALRIAWVEQNQMRAFEQAYRRWLEQLALATQGIACDLTGALNQLLDILPQLRSVYPEATLYDPERGRSDDIPVVLNRTALGTAED